MSKAIFVSMAVSLLMATPASSQTNLRSVEMANCAALFDVLTDVGPQEIGAMQWKHFEPRWMNLAVSEAVKLSPEQLAFVRQSSAELWRFHISQLAAGTLSGIKPRGDLQDSILSCALLVETLKTEGKWTLQ